LKGLELPVNALVVLTIAVVVLVGVVFLFTGTFSGGKSSFQLDIVKNTACKKLVEIGCDTNTDEINNLDISLGPDGKPKTGDDTLTRLCDQYYNKKTQQDCRTLCGC